MTSSVGDVTLIALSQQKVQKICLKILAPLTGPWWPDVSVSCCSQIWRLKMVHFSVIVLNRPLEEWYSQDYCPEREERERDWRHLTLGSAQQQLIFHHSGRQLTVCIPAACTPSECVAESSRRHTHSANQSRGCAPAGHAEATWDVLRRRGVVVCFSRRLPLCSRWHVINFTWEGRVDLKARHTSKLVLSSDTVLGPVAGLV